jgi:seryl-tRNA synthetase
VLDINLFREEKGGNPEAVRESQRRRGKPVEDVDRVIALDREWVKLRFDVDELNKRAKQLQTQIAEKMKAKQGAEAEPLVREREALVREREAVEAVMAAKETELRTLICNMGNIVHESVPGGTDERLNPVVRTHFRDGVEPRPLTPAEKTERSILPHHQVLYRLDGYDAERGAKVAGHRGYFLKNIGVRLNQALINYGLDFLAKRTYTLLQTPFLMRREMMAKCAQLDDFDDQLYKVAALTADGQDDARYLIATSEQPIASFHADEWFDDPAAQLPARYCGYSTCFRKEAGAHGRDTWGLFRIHQFEKIEQFVITEPEHSWNEFEEMIAASEAFYQSLGLSYRVVCIVGGALNNAAAKKYDLEAWFPNYGEYKELVSCSNCTDYQSRRLEIRCGLKRLGDRDKRYVHCLNCTLTATERTLCALLENFQTPEGLAIPEPLQPYLGGLAFVPYVRPAQ